jgi:hypothetical protein
MPERLKRIGKMRDAWAQRKKSTEYRIASIATEIFKLNGEEELLIKFHDGNKGLVDLFPEVSILRLIGLNDQKAEFNKKMDFARAAHRQDSLGLKRCEIFEERLASDLRQKDEADALESIFEVFLLRNRESS